ncbi:SKA complex subunit 1-like [Panulirus ornatus]|uniref:SKA complex subunit 1-like n=1 Tax=Panulirus ornatus TaxID=150431 RepID=UPI003A890B92
MAIVNSSETLTMLDVGFRNKIDNLQICADLRGHWREDTVAELEHLGSELQALHQDVVKYKCILSHAKKDIQASHALLEQMQQLSVRLTHMKNNLPAHLPRPTAPTYDVSVPSSTTKKMNVNKENIHPDCQAPARIGQSKAKQIPVIDYVTVEEFESVSKYLRGRLQYDQINNAVDQVNKTLETKYALMSRPRSKVSEIDMRIVTACKRQENQETRGLHFVVDDDIKRWSRLKMDSTGRSQLTLLRTLKRVREVRGPGNIVRYAVIV